MEKQAQLVDSGSGYAVRADPLQVALEAISESERVQAAAGYGYAALARRAQLRTLYAMAEELRLFRLEQRGARQVADGDE